MSPPLGPLNVCCYVLYRCTPPHSFRCRVCTWTIQANSTTSTYQRKNASQTGTAWQQLLNDSPGRE
uniref:Uncharacterized protein n=1 Tax=Anopheles quadriannulatus TaxID=34691 RepID=A0A182XTY2_ANOQN